MRYVGVDLFGKTAVGKTTIFKLFADPQSRLMQEGGNLSYDFRTYYARCWIFPRRWEHSMVFLADPKFDMRYQSLDMKMLKKAFEPTNVLIIVSDSTREDVEAIKHSLQIYPRIKLGLIIFIIANMQDKPGVLPVEEIKQITGINDVLGLIAIQSNARAKVEPFIEEGVKRFFHMLAKRGDWMELIDDIPTNKTQKDPNCANQGKKQFKEKDADSEWESADKD